MKLRALIVLGTRPEAIKLAPLIIRMKETGLFSVSVCSTGQHREMLDQVLDAFRIVPEYDLHIMRHNQVQSQVISNLLVKLDPVILETKPDVLVVQGDTTTAFIAGFAAFHLKIPIAHVEAGLRTYDKYSPFPEEVNRRLLSCIADFHFAPTNTAKKNLLKENIPAKSIFVTGNTAIDALVMTKKNLSAGKVHGTLPAIVKSIKGWFILVTAHRRESFGASLREMFKALVDIVERNPTVEIVYPVHLNPNVQIAAKKILAGYPQIHLIQPLDYVSFIELMDLSYMILTDSGGIQEEAMALRKPVLVMREVTERTEAIKAGGAKLVGTARRNIVLQVESLLNSRSEYRKMVNIINPYGAGKASDSIAKTLAKTVKSRASA